MEPSNENIESQTSGQPVLQESDDSDDSCLICLESAKNTTIMIQLACCTNRLCLCCCIKACTRKPNGSLSIKCPFCRTFCINRDVVNGIKYHMRQFDEEKNTLSEQYMALGNGFSHDMINYGLLEMEYTRLSNEIQDLETENVRLNQKIRNLKNRFGKSKTDNKVPLKKKVCRKKVTEIELDDTDDVGHAIDFELNRMANLFDEGRDEGLEDADSTNESAEVPGMALPPLHRLNIYKYGQSNCDYIVRTGDDIDLLKDYQDFCQHCELEYVDRLEGYFTKSRKVLEILGMPDWKLGIILKKDLSIKRECQS